MPFLGKTPSQIVDPEVDIDGGTIDGVSIGSVTANAGAFTNLTATGTLTLPDDGISGDDVNGGTISNFASTGIDDNATSTKVTVSDTGIDVTGNVTADDLDVQQAGFTSVLVGSTNAGGSMLVLDGDSNGDGAGGDYSYIYHNTDGQLELLQNSPAGTNEMLFKTAGNNLRMKIGSGGDISFYEDTGTTQAFFWDASTSRLGIDTTGPTTNLHVSGTTGTKALFENTGSTGSFIGLKDSSGSLVYLGDNNGTFEVQTAGSSYATKLAVTSAGNVGIGTDNPAFLIEAYGATNASTGWNAGGTVTGFAQANTSNSDFRIGTTTSHALGLYTQSIERIKVDSSGNVLVGGSFVGQANSCSIDQDGNITQVSASGVASSSLFGAISGVSNGFQIQSTASNTHIYTLLNGPNVAMKLADGKVMVNTGTSSSNKKLIIAVAPNSTSDDGIQLQDPASTNFYGTLGLTGSAYSYRNVPANQIMLYGGGKGISFLTDGSPLPITFHDSTGEYARFNAQKFSLGATTTNSPFAVHTIRGQKAFCGNFVHNSSGITTDILRLHSLAGNVTVGISIKLRACNAITNQYCIIEFHASAHRTGGATPTLSVTTPSITVPINTAPNISGGGVTWDSSTLTLKYTSSFSVSYWGFSVEADVMAHDAAGCTFLV